MKFVDIMDTPKSFDEAKLNELREILDNDEVNGLVRDFLELCAADMSSLKDAVANNVHADVFHIAHGLKSSSGSLGFEKLSELCSVLESQARNGRLQDAALQVSNLEAEFKYLKSMFSHLLPS